VHHRAKVPYRWDGGKAALANNPRVNRLAALFIIVFFSNVALNAGLSIWSTRNGNRLPDLFILGELFAGIGVAIGIFCYTVWIAGRVEY
jgi:hypothetical protein